MTDEQCTAIVAAILKGVDEIVCAIYNTDPERGDSWNDPDSDEDHVKRARALTALTKGQ